MKNPKTYFLIVAFLIGNTLLAQGWNPVTNTGTSFILYGMSFPPGQSTIGYACGMQYTYNAPGVIVKTTDGGYNWTQIWPSSGSIDGLQGIWFINDTVGFACGWNNYFIKTTDGGNTWTNISVGTNVWYYVDVEFWDENNGIAAANMNNPGDQAVFITSDGGNTWTPATSGVGTNEIMGVSYADQNTIFAVGTGSNVFKSTDGGHNWTIVTTLSAMLFGVDFANTSFGVAGGEEKMFATNDGGNTWSTYTTGYENFYATKAFADGTGYVGGTDERIYITTDYGNNWSLDNSGSGSSSLYRIRFTSNTASFACGSQGTILMQEPQFLAGFTADNTEICEGDNVNYTDQSTGNIVSWEWTFEGGTPSTSSSQNPSVTYNTAGIYDVQLVISDGSNYDTLLQQDYITANAIPSQASKPTGPYSVCEGGSYDYSTTPVTYADSYSWQVSPADAGSITGDGTTATFDAANNWTGTYSIRVRAENVCGNGTWSDTIQCTLFHQPEEYNFIGGGGYCEGGAGRELILEGSETGVDYELFLDDVSTGTIIPGTGSSLSFGFHTTVGFYTVIGYTDHCTEDMPGENYVFVQPLPGQPGSPSGPESVCNGDTTVYTTSGASNADNYNWTVDPPGAGTLIPNGTEVQVAWDAGFSGTAFLSVMASNECGDGPGSDDLEISVETTPSPEISGESTVCEEDIFDYMTTENPGNTYSWNVTGGTIIAGSGTHQVTVQWGIPGTGTLEVTEDNGTCLAVSEIFEVVIDECTFIEEIARAALKIYPNPASDILNVKINGLPYAGTFEIRIVNNLGVTMDMRIPATGENVQTLNISSLKSGLYFIQLVDGESVLAFQKFMVSR